jgi:transposase
MPWTEITRPNYVRAGLRYASDLTDAEWKLIEPLLPPPSSIGRPRTTALRAVVDALLYMATTGCQWRQLSKEFPPYSTVQGYFYAWAENGTFAAISQTLMEASRTMTGSAASPSAGVIDSQSVKTTESGGPRGFDAAKKINGRKRHIVTDTQGHLIALHVHPANIQDRDGAVDLLQIVAKNYPDLLHFFADSAYAGEYLRNALAGLGAWCFEIIRRSDDTKGFVVLPRRWVVERTFAWLGRCRRLAKDFEATIRSAVAWILISHIRLLTRRLARAA